VRVDGGAGPRVKILHVIARLNVGGAALSVLELAAEQQRRGHDVLVVAGRIPQGEESMEHVAVELGVRHEHLPVLQRELSARADAEAIRFLRTKLRTLRPDVLHTHTSKAGATGRLAALAAGAGRPAAIVHHFHGHVLTEYFSPARERFFRVLERGLAATSGALIAVSDEVRDDLLRLKVAPAAKIRVVRYGFDLDRRTRVDEGAALKLREQAGIAADAFVAGWAGRLTAVKRPLDLIRVAAAAGGLELLLAGDGELRGEVEALAAQLGVADRVHFLGYVQEIAPVYAASDALLLTSANEGTPVVAIEALAAGVPVVATDAGGTRTVVDDGETGFLSPVGDTSALAERIERLDADPSLRRAFGDMGAARMRERFSTERMADDVARIYDELIAR
jgi:glycosyltransferase involved in cell wall biosynthesis